jgi:hypothetical protein
MIQAILVSVFGTVVAQTNTPTVLATAPALEIRAARGAAFTLEDRQLLFRRIIADPQLARVRNNRLRQLSIVPATPEKAGEANPRVATSVIFDYTIGRAYRVTLNLATGSVATFETLAGRPQASLEEIGEAKAITMRDARHTVMFDQGARLEGGFVVDPPPGGDPRHRYLQFHITTHDYAHFIRVVTVDLTDGKVAASTAAR